jgi:group I intron endonuclease
MIRNIQNLKIYIGSSKNTQLRWKDHRSRLRRGSHSNDHLQAAWDCYGEEAFEFIVIQECLEEELLFQEKLFIERMRSADKQFGYNICEDPTRNTPSEETRKKIGAWHKGKTISQRQREGASKTHKGVPKSQEHKDKIAQGRLGKRHSEETKRGISEKKRGKIRINNGQDQKFISPEELLTYEAQGFKRGGLPWKKTKG